MTLTPAQAQWLAEQEEINRQRAAAVREWVASLRGAGHRQKRAAPVDDVQYDHDRECEGDAQ